MDMRGDTFPIKGGGGLGKALRTKREKSETTEAVLCRITVHLQVNRETLAKIAGAPTSRWADGLYNELGAPVVAATLLLPDHLVVEGIVTAGGPQLDAPVLPKTRPQFRMPRAVMLNVRATLLPLVAEVTAILEWVARGDEIDDVRELLGKEVTFDLVAADVQGDLLAKLNAPNAAAPPAGDGDEHAQLAAGLEKAIHSRRSRRDVRADA